MNINELKTGNIIVNREGDLGVVLKEAEYILYQEGGMDDLFEFNDELELENEDTPDFDIMEVYEGGSFSDYEEYVLLWQRDIDWNRPNAEEGRAIKQARRRKQEVERKLTEQKWVEKRHICEENRANHIYVMAQYFYGNRTGTEIHRKNVDALLAGWVGEPLDSARIEVEREIVHVPNTDGLVIVFDRKHENEYVNKHFPSNYKENEENCLEICGEKHKIYVSCKIPEIGFKIYTRCIACRMDENGILQSLKDGDEEIVNRYFPAD